LRFAGVDPPQANMYFYDDGTADDFCAYVIRLNLRIQVATFQKKATPSCSFFSFLVSRPGLLREIILLNGEK